MKTLVATLFVFSIVCSSLVTVTPTAPTTTSSDRLACDGPGMGGGYQHVCFHDGPGAGGGYSPATCSNAHQADGPGAGGGYDGLET